MTDAELAILNLIAEAPCHGYEIEQTIEKRGMRAWTAVGFSSIYYLLNKLEKEGLVESELAQAKRGPARRVYQITPAGRQAQGAALIESLSEPVSHHSRLLLGISSLPAVEPGEAVSALELYNASLEKRQADLRSTWHSQRPLPYFVEALFEYSETMIQAERAWVAGFIRRLQEENPRKEGQHDQD
jgi:DNA-binding PadR family transcriptional regulator